VIITRTPLRVSFFGGGTDLPNYSNRFGGSVVSTTIDKYVYISAHPLMDTGKTLLKYSRIEYVENPSDLIHPIARVILSEKNINGIDLGVTSDVPSGTGMGSSSAFTVGLLNLINSYEGKFATPQSLAEEACRIELEVLGEPIGKQDQVIAAFGGLNYIEFQTNGRFSVTPIVIPPESQRFLEESLVLVRFGGTRSAGKALANLISQNNEKSEALEALHRLKSLTELGPEILRSNPDKLGELLTKSWNLKIRSSQNPANSAANEYIKMGIDFGASGGKLLGAGEAGFILFQIDIKKKDEFLRKLGNPIVIPFIFENTGSRVIYAK
jgi:D-glycero-alpha-D-manno-heptose-7-phosphate kinase